MMQSQAHLNGSGLTSADRTNAPATATKKSAITT
jgi:hypothetical protein